MTKLLRASTLRRLLLVSVALLSGCYSFTGASIPSHIHTIGIPLVEDNSGYGQSSIRQNLTDKLILEFTSEGSLRVANRANADALLECVIQPGGVIDEPVSVRAGEAVTNKRITLTVHAAYRDQKKGKLFWDRAFTETRDYAIASGLSGLSKALQEAEAQAAKDILIAAISNW